MKYVDEFRNPTMVRSLSSQIQKAVTRPWALMEVCGGQTHTIVKFGLDSLLPKEVSLVHGPGCPVCVTPVDILDKAMALASRPHVIFCSFGDMLRVPGSRQDLLTVKSLGGDVRVVYSPLDAVKVAEKNPNKEVVFFAVGFETTAPANAMAVLHAQEKGIHNFSLLVSHVLVPPAMEAVLSSPNNRVQGFLAAGHVCTIMGYEEYIPLVKAYNVPIVVTGFEPVDILEGVFMAVKQLEEGRCEVENQYIRSVRREGNAPAQNAVQKVFQVVPRSWRGLGELPASGLGLRLEYKNFDALKKFNLKKEISRESPECVSGDILRGLKKPMDCAAFGKACTPDHPLGAPMVSSEGACAAYYQYRRIYEKDKADSHI